MINTENIAQKNAQKKISKKIFFNSVLLAIIIFISVPAKAENKPAKVPDIFFVPTPYEAVEIMFRLAELKKDDIVYDLGCGDGRIVIAAAKKAGARAVGFDIDPEMVRRSRENVKNEGLTHLVTIEEKDIFEVDLSKATVVTLYLIGELNLRLVPQFKKLKPGSRIVSHQSDIWGATPDVKAIVYLPDGYTSLVYLWTTPLKKIDLIEEQGTFKYNNPDRIFNHKIAGKKAYRKRIIKKSITALVML